MTHDAQSAAMPRGVPSELRPIEFRPLADAEFQLFQALIYRVRGQGERDPESLSEALYAQRPPEPGEQDESRRRAPFRHRVSALNLNDEDYLLGERFDLVFCRNVLIYFSVESRMRVIRRLLSRLQPTGYLFVGHAETLGGMSEVRGVIPTVYCSRQRSGAAEPSGARVVAGATEGVAR